MKIFSLLYSVTRHTTSYRYYSEYHSYPWANMKIFLLRNFVSRLIDSILYWQQNIFYPKIISLNNTRNWYIIPFTGVILFRSFSLYIYIYGKLLPLDYSRFIAFTLHLELYICYYVRMPPKRFSFDEGWFKINCMSLALQLLSRFHAETQFVQIWGVSLYFHIM